MLHVLRVYLALVDVTVNSECTCNPFVLKQFSRRKIKCFTKELLTSSYSILGISNKSKENIETKESYKTTAS